MPAPKGPFSKRQTEPKAGAMKRKRGEDKRGGEVPQDVLVDIMRRIERRDQMRAACACRNWREAVQEARQPLKDLHVEGQLLSDRKEKSVDVGFFPNVGRSITVFRGDNFSENTLEMIHRVAGTTLRGLHIINTGCGSMNDQEESKDFLQLDFSRYNFPVLEYLHLENLTIASLGQESCSVPALEHLSVKGRKPSTSNWTILKRPLLDLECCLPELRTCFVESVMLLSPTLFVQSLQKSPLLSHLRVWNSTAFPFLWPFPCQSIHLRNCKVLEWIDVAWFPAKFWLPKLKMATIGSMHLPSVPEVEFLGNPTDGTESTRSGNVKEEPSRGAFVLTVLGRNMKVSKGEAV